MIRPVPAEQLPQWWPVLAPYFEDFAERSDGRITVQGLLDGVRDRERQAYVWWTGEGVGMCALTRLAQYPGGLAVHVDHCAGLHADQWREAFDEHLRQWAEAIGASRIISMARPGWSRWAKQRGYREAHREMILEVGHG